jgi:hypothetical protein
MQTDTTTGAAMDLILDAAGYPAADRDIDTGLSTMSRFWARKGSVLELLRELEAQEAGLLRETKDGKIQFESRAHRASAPHTTARSTYGTGTLRPWQLQQENPLLDIYNSIEAKVRTFNKSDTVTLATIVDIRNGQGGPPIPFANGETKVIDIEFPTPSSPSQFLAVQDWGIVTVEVNTTQAGDGADLTNDPLLTMTREELGRTLRCTFVNGTGSAGYFIRLLVNGVAIIEGDPLTVNAEDATSQAKFRKRPFQNPSQWLTDVDEGQDYCDHIIALYKDPRPALRFTLKANYNSTHLAEAQAIDVSDRIHITANLGTFGLGINGDFFVESLHHKVNEGRIHEVQVYCRSIVTHSWPASGASYTAREVPDGVPDDLYVTGMDPDLQIVCGARAWKYNRNITGARFRARYYTDPLGSDQSADLRTIAEGGDMEHNPAGGMYVVDNIFANQYGCQYDFTSFAEGTWYYAFQFTSTAGDSVWTDGNKTPQYVQDYVDAVSGQAATGPPDDWWVEVIPDPSGRHAVIVRASRPKVNGGKIWAWVAQIKDNRTGAWYSVSEDIDEFNTTANIHYGDIAESNNGDIDHTISRNNTRLTRESGTGLTGFHYPGNDFCQIGDLTLLDVRGSGNFAEAHCQWGTVDLIQGLKTGFNVATATYFDVQGRFRPLASTDLRLLTVNGPWNWTGYGYFGAEPNHGLYERWYGDNGEHGDTTTEIFVSAPIDVPAAVPLSAIEARVWFDNGYSRYDGGIITGQMVGSEGNPSGATGLQILTHDDDPQIPAGYIALQWNRETLNYKDISVVAAWFSSALPAEGPYAAERAGHPATVLEEGTCEIVRGNKRINVTRPSPPAASVEGKILLIYTDDASPDSDLDGNVIVSATATTITVSDRTLTDTNPFMRSGTFHYAIVDCWWPNEGSSNLAYCQWSVGQVTQDIEATVWRTPIIKMPSGSYYVTLANRNPYGLGTRLIPGGVSTPDPPTEVHPQACTPLSVVTGEVDTNADLGPTFTITSASGFTLNNPTGTLYCGQTLLWMITGAGVPTLDDKFRLMDGQAIAKSSGRDLLGAIYNAADDQWDAFWQKGS